MVVGVLEKRQRGVFGGEDRVRNGPVDVQDRIVPTDAAVALRCVFAGDFVEDGGFLTEDTKTVGESDGNIEHLESVGRKVHADPAPIGGRTVAKVHRNVEDFPVNGDDEFGLGVGMFLVMQAAEDATGRVGKVVLNKADGQSVGLKGGLFVGFEKTSARIRVALCSYEDDFGNVLRLEGKGHRSGFGGDAAKIMAVSVGMSIGQSRELGGVNVAHPVGDFFGTGDHETLAILDGLDEVGRL